MSNVSVVEAVFILCVLGQMQVLMPTAQRATVTTGSPTAEQIQPKLVIAD